MPDETPKPSPPRDAMPPPTSWEELVFRLLAESLEETNTQAARMLDMEQLILALHMGLRSASLAGKIHGHLKDEIDAYLDDLETEEGYGNLFSATKEHHPFMERSTLKAEGVDPIEQWSDSYRDQKARMAPVVARLGAFALAAGLLPQERPTPRRIIEARLRDYGVAAEAELVHMTQANGNGDKEAEHGAEAYRPSEAPPLPRGQLRPRFGRVVRDQDAVRDPDPHA